MKKVLLCTPAPLRVETVSDACATALDDLGGVLLANPERRIAHAEVLADLTRLHLRLKEAGRRVTSVPS